jgi:hypothetical protein
VPSASRSDDCAANRLKWLRLIEAENLAPIDEVRPLLNEANELVAIFTTSVKRLRLTATAGIICLTLVFAYGVSYGLSYGLSYYHF